MTNFVLEQNVTSLEDSKRLAEAGIDLEADVMWQVGGDCAVLYLANYEPRNLEDFPEGTYFIKAYRLDRLLAELPEWWEKLIVYFNEYNDKKLKQLLEGVVPSNKVRKVYMLMVFIISQRSQEAIKAACDLLILLKKEGINEGN